jgi:hypothetical protein
MNFNINIAISEFIFLMILSLLSFKAHRLLKHSQLELVNVTYELLEKDLAKETAANKQEY